MSELSNDRVEEERNSTTIHVRVEQDLKDQLDRHVMLRSIAEGNKVTASDVLREVMKNYLDTYEMKLLSSARETLENM